MKIDDRHALTRKAAAEGGLELRTASLFELTRTPSAVFRGFVSPG